MNSREKGKRGEQDAYFGLYEAAMRFDESKGYKFLTYAEWYIRCRVNAGRNAIIRLPQAVKRDMIKIEAVRAELAQKLKYAPTAEEISRQTGIAVERIKYLQRTVKPVQSIYEPICSAEDLTVEDGIEDDSIRFEDDIADNDERRYVQKLVSELPRRKRKIIELFYFSGMTLKQIAAAEGIDAAAVYRLKKSALRDLRREMRREFIKIRLK